MNQSCLLHTVANYILFFSRSGEKKDIHVLTHRCVTSYQPHTFCERSHMQNIFHACTPVFGNEVKMLPLTYTKVREEDVLPQQVSLFNIYLD